MLRLRYNGYLIIMVLLFLTVTGCSTTKNTTENTVQTVGSNSRRWSSGKVSKVIRSHNITYHTLSARVHIDYENGDKQYHNVTAYLRMKKDSIIWLSVRPVLGIEMARLVLTPDSIKLRNNLKRTVYLRSADDIQQLLHIPFDFSIIESLLLGNLPAVPKKIKQYETDTSGLSVTLDNGPVIRQYYWTLNPFLLRKSYFKMSENPASANQIFSDYKKYEEAGSFSLKRNIRIQASDSIHIRINFDKVQFNSPVQFPFQYNKAYKVL